MLDYASLLLCRVGELLGSPNVVVQRCRNNDSRAFSDRDVDMISVAGLEKALATLFRGGVIDDGFTPVHYVITPAIFIAASVLTSIKL